MVNAKAANLVEWAKCVSIAFVWLVMGAIGLTCLVYGMIFVALLAYEICSSLVLACFAIVILSIVIGTLGYLNS